MQLQTKNISISTSGDNTIVAGVANNPIRIWNLVLTNNVATANVVLVKDGASTTLATLSLPASVGGSVVLQIGDTSTGSTFQTSPGNAFILNLSAATVVNGYVNYSIGG
jgi:hypothetical protein